MGRRRSLSATVSEAHWTEQVLPMATPLHCRRMEDNKTKQSLHISSNCRKLSTSTNLMCQYDGSGFCFSRISANGSPLEEPPRKAGSPPHCWSSGQEPHCSHQSGASQLQAPDLWHPRVHSFARYRRPCPGSSGVGPAHHQGNPPCNRGSNRLDDGYLHLVAHTSMHILSSTPPLD